MKKVNLFSLQKNNLTAEKKKLYSPEAKKLNDEYFVDLLLARNWV